MSSMLTRPQARIVGGLALSAMLVGSSVPMAVGQDGGSARLPGLATIDDAAVDGIVADIEQAALLATERLESLRSDRLHRDVVIEQVGSDPLAIGDWVSENTIWVPYQGALRGADGVLLDRTGNSLDRSLLLAALLEEAGHAATLANAALAPELAASIVSEASARDGVAASTPVLASAEAIDGFRAAVSRSSDAIASSIELGATTAAATDSMVVAAADHWWVQTIVDGSIVDLDPAGIADNGDILASAASVELEDLPADLRHRVTMRVVAERTQDGETSTFVPFDYSIDVGSGPSLSSFELSFDNTIADPPDDELDLDGMAAAITHWRPALSGPGVDVVGDWFTTDGRLEIPAVTPTRDLFGDATDSLGGLGADEGSDSGPSALTALWLEYETTGPGLEPRLERRDLLREASPTATDVSAALLGATNILVQTSNVDPIAFERMLLEDIVEARSALIALTVMAAGREDDRILPSLQSADLEPSNLWALALARGHWGTDPGAFFIGRPNIWSEHETFEQTADGLVSGSALDIVHNDIEVVPAASEAASRLRLEQGILDTLIEQALVAAPGPENTWARYDAALADGTGWSSFTDGADLSPLGANLPAADVQRMLDATRAGDVVIVDPAAADGIASWWRIDPADGRTLGIGPKGWGTVGERSGVHQVPAAVLRAFQRTQGASTGRAGRNLARQAAQYARNNPFPEPGRMTVFEVVNGVIQRIYIL